MSDLPNKMMALKIVNPGADYRLKSVQLPVPKFKDTEVLIQTTAFGINRPDVVQCEGRYPAPKGVTDIPGLEISGRVVALGSHASAQGRFNVGDRVCALVAGGGYADYCTAPIEQILPIPESLTDLQAAALPETFFTVWSNVFDRAELKKGEKILIHGGSSGIGTTAIQLANTFGAEVFVTCGSDEKTRYCESLGAVCAINYNKENFVSVIREKTQNAGVDVVLDMVGGDYLSQNLSCLALEGRHVSIAMLRGMKAEVNIFDIMRRRLVLTGSTLRARSPEFKGKITKKLLKNVWPLIDKGHIKPVIHDVFEGFDQVLNAHQVMKSSKHIGKLVIQL